MTRPHDFHACIESDQFNRLVGSVGAWSQKNFGPLGSRNPGHVQPPWLAPFWGIVEEVAELADATKRDDSEDAIGDIVIYLCDYEYRFRKEFTNCNSDPVATGTPSRLRGKLWTIDHIMAALGKLYRAHLKRFQGIRGMDNETAFFQARRLACQQLLRELDLEAHKRTGNGALDIAEIVFSGVVEKRDWRKNPETGTA